MAWFLGTSHSTVYVQFVCRKKSPTNSSILKTVWVVCVCSVYILISDTKESVVSCLSLSSTPDSGLFSLWPISGHSNTGSRELRYSPGKCVSPLWSVSLRVYTIVIQFFFDGNTAACFKSLKMCTADKGEARIELQCDKGNLISALFLNHKKFLGCSVENLLGKRVPEIPSGIWDNSMNVNFGIGYEGIGWIKLLTQSCLC